MEPVGELGMFWVFSHARQLEYSPRMESMRILRACGKPRRKQDKSPVTSAS